MSILMNLGALSGVMNGAASVIRELKRPRVSGDDFAKILEAQLTQARSGEAAKAQRERRVAWVNQTTQRFVTVRDANGDSMLSRDESGLDQNVFAQFDVDKDGKLTLDELRKPMLSAAAAE